MAGAVNYLMAKEMRDAKVALAINGIEFNDASLGEFLHTGVHDIGCNVVIAGEHLGLDSPRMVLPATHVIDKWEQAHESEPGIDRALG